MATWIRHSAGLGAGNLGSAAARRAKADKKARHGEESATQRKLREAEERGPARRGRPVVDPVLYEQRKREEEERARLRVEIERLKRVLVSLVRREQQHRDLKDIAEQIGMSYPNLGRLMRHHIYYKIQAAE